MGRAWAMASFAADRQLRKGFIFKFAVGVSDRSWTSTVASDTSGKDRSIEAKVRKLISWRRCPAFGFGIERQRRLKEVVVILNDCPKSICACAYDPLDWSGFPKAFPTIGSRTDFAFVQRAVFGRDFESPIEPLVDVFGGRTRLLRKFRRRDRHGTAHTCLGKLSIKFYVASGARL